MPFPRACEKAGLTSAITTATSNPKLQPAMEQRPACSTGKVVAGKAVAEAQVAS
jgi:hypothetical protein